MRAHRIVLHRLRQLLHHWIRLGEGVADLELVQDLSQADQTKTQGVLQIMGGIGDFIGKVHDLGVDAFAAFETLLRQFGTEELVVLVVEELRRIVLPAMKVLGHRHQRTDIEVEPVVQMMLALQGTQNTKGLGIAFISATVATQFVEHFFSMVPEWRVADVMGQRCSLGDDSVIERQVNGYRTRDLCDLQAVGEAIAVEAPGVDTQQLHLALQAPEGRGVQDPGIVAHEFLTPIGSSIVMDEDSVLNFAASISCSLA